MAPSQASETAAFTSPRIYPAGKKYSAVAKNKFLNQHRMRPQEWNLAPSNVLQGRLFNVEVWGRLQ
jgi:hypothetical protein